MKEALNIFPSAQYLAENKLFLSHRHLTRGVKGKCRGRWADAVLESEVRIALLCSALAGTLSPAERRAKRQ